MADEQYGQQRVERNRQRAIPQCRSRQTVGPGAKLGIERDHGGDREAEARDQEREGGVVHDADHGDDGGHGLRPASTHTVSIAPNSMPSIAGARGLRANSYSSGKSLA